MANINEHSDINRLISRFLDGETSLDEEKTLYAFFSRPDVPEELEPYRPMFGWYASLAVHNDETDRPDNDGERSALSATPVKKDRPLFRLLRPWQWAGIAAMLAVLFTVGFFLRTPSIPEEYLAYEGSYIIRNGKKITDLRIVVPEILRTQQVVDESLEAITATFEESDRSFDAAVINSCDLSDPVIKEAISTAFDL